MTLEEAKKSAEENEEKTEEAIPKAEEETEKVEEIEVAEEEEETEEVKPPAREEAEEEEIVEERFYTIPLGKAWVAPRDKRAPRAIRIIRDFIRRHMKLEAGEGEEEETEPKRIIISNEVNERIWSRGIQKPPRKIRVRAAKDKDGNVTVYLAEGD